MTYHHWNFFSSICHDFVELSRFVEITEANYPTHSLEMARLLLAVGSEVEVVSKRLASAFNPKAALANMDEIRAAILGVMPEFPDATVELQSYPIVLSPWASWKNNENPTWWRAHNKVKHQRDSHFSEANLANLLDGVAGLCVLVYHLYHDEFRLGKIQDAQFFMTPGRKHVMFSTTLMRRVYCLPGRMPQTAHEMMGLAPDTKI